MNQPLLENMWEEKRFWKTDRPACGQECAGTDLYSVSVLLSLGNDGGDRSNYRPATNNDIEISESSISEWSIKAVTDFTKPYWSNIHVHIVQMGTFTFELVEDGPEFSDVSGKRDVRVQDDDSLQVRRQRLGEHELHEAVDSRVMFVGDP